MLDRGSLNSSREDVVKAVGIRAVKANSNANHNRVRVEEQHRDPVVEEEVGHQSAIAAVLGAILPRTAPLWVKMLDEEASRPQGVEDEASLATAVRLQPMVSPRVYMRW